MNVTEVIEFIFGEEGIKFDADGLIQMRDWIYEKKELQQKLDLLARKMHMEVDRAALIKRERKYDGIQLDLDDVASLLEGKQNGRTNRKIRKDKKTKA